MSLKFGQYLLHYPNFVPVHLQLETECRKEPLRLAGDHPVSSGCSASVRGAECEPGNTPSVSRREHVPHVSIHQVAPGCVVCPPAADCGGCRLSGVAQPPGRAASHAVCRQITIDKVENRSRIWRTACFDAPSCLFFAHTHSLTHTPSRSHPTQHRNQRNFMAAACFA